MAARARDLANRPRRAQRITEEKSLCSDSNLNSSLCDTVVPLGQVDPC